MAELTELLGPPDWAEVQIDPKGIAVGSSVAALKEAYPGVRFFRECDAEQWSIAIGVYSECPPFLHLWSHPT